METSPASRLNVGDVLIKLVDEEMVLKPTFLACQELSKTSGGLARLQQSIVNMDFNAIVGVIGVGLGVKIDDDLREKVYKSSLYNLWWPCSEFISIISNGGKPITQADPNKKDAGTDNSPQV